MTNPKQDRLNKEEVLCLRGLRLSAISLKKLQRAGIYCQPAISIEFEQSAQRYVLRGVESGGAVSTIGAYCGFVGENGTPLISAQPVNSVAVNGLHLAVLSPVLVRIQLFRTGATCELLITHQSLSPVEAKTRPVLRSSVLFEGRHGRLEMELWGKDPQPKEIASPVFYSQSGEQITAPDRYHDTIVRVTAGACCIGCRQAHVTEFIHSPVDSGMSRLGKSPEGPSA